MMTIRMAQPIMLICIALVALPAAGQTDDLQPAVDAYLATFAPDIDVQERDRRRSVLVDRSYFYHGTDGNPIDFTGLAQRQVGNRLVTAERRILNKRIHRAGNTALVTFHASEAGEDKGRPFRGTGSWVTVFTRTPDGWRVMADIVGQDPAPPN